MAGLCKWNIRDKRNYKRRIYMCAILMIVLAFYIPSFLSKIYICSDEFSSIAAPAILSGHNWIPTVKYHSYHGVGYTIFMTPFFAFVKSGIVAHRIILVFALLLKIVFAELLFCMFFDYFELGTCVSFSLSIMYICGPLGGDEYGLSAMSETPFAFCLFMAVYMWMKYIKRRKKIHYIMAMICFAYTYLIHSRCLILYISLVITGVIYIIRERPLVIDILKKIAIFTIVLWVVYCLLNVVQGAVYLVEEGKQLTNDPGMVLSESSDQIKKLLQVEWIIDTLKICFSLTTAQCMITLGVGTIALLCCIYVIFMELTGTNKFSKSIFYLSMISVLCIFGMNFAIGIQSVERVRSGDFAWLTYIRYAEPFWILPYIVLSYMLKHALSSELRNVILLGTVSCGGFINLFLAKILSEGNGLAWSVLNRLFYRPYFDVKGYFFIFIKVMYISTLILVIVWNSKFYKKIGIIMLMCMMMTINYQYEKYYVDKQREEYEAVDRSNELIDKLTQFNPEIQINADVNALMYSSKLQFLTFDVTLNYALNTQNFPYGNIMFTDVDNYVFDNPDISRIQIDEDEYVYVFDDVLDNMINRWVLGFE